VNASVRTCLSLLAATLALACGSEASSSGEPLGQTGSAFTGSFTLNGVKQTCRTTVQTFATKEFSVLCQNPSAPDSLVQLTFFDLAEAHTEANLALREKSSGIGGTPRFVRIDVDGINGTTPAGVSVEVTRFAGGFRYTLPASVEIAQTSGTRLVLSELSVTYP
jgi:hypothetical protein